MAITRSGRDAPPPPPPLGGPVSMVSEPPPSHLCRSLPNSSNAPPTAPKLFPINHPPWSSIATPILPTKLQEDTHFQPWPDLPSDHCNLIFANPKEYFPPNPSYYPPQPQPQYYQTQQVYSPNIRQPPTAPPPYARRNPQEKQGVNLSTFSHISYYPPSVRSDVSLIASSSITHPHRSKEWVDQYLKSLQEKARKQSPPPYYMEYCQEKARRYPTPLQYREYLQEKMGMQPTREVSMSAALPIVDVVEEEENDGELAIGNNEADQESEASKQDAEATSSQYFNNHGSHFFPKPMPVVEVSLGEMQSTVSAVLEENVEALVEQHRCINIGSLYAQVKELRPWTNAKFVKEVIDASCFTSILVHSSLARLTIALWGSEERYSKYTSENGSEMVGIVIDASLAPEMHTLEATPVCKALYFLGVMGKSTCSLLDKIGEDGIVRQGVELIEDGTIVVIFDPGGGGDEATLAGLPGTKASLLEEFGVRLVTYDLPGFGESDPHPGRNLSSSAVDMLQLADGVGIIDKFWVVGYTGGGKHAWSAVRYIPERLAGVPVTFFGDLKNQFVEANVGFDTICRVNSQLVSNICTDALSAEKYYYFIRLMGRRASHVTLKCALQSHPNMVILSEEVTSSKLTLFDITKRICDAVQARAEQDKYHGVLLLPEGLIESIPEVYALLQEIHVLLMNGVTAGLKTKTFPEGSFLNIDVPADVAHHKGIKITKQGRFIIRTGWKQTDNSGSLSEESYQTANMTGVSVADTEDGAFATPSEALFFERVIKEHGHEEAEDDVEEDVDSVALKDGFITVTPLSALSHTEADARPFFKSWLTRLDDSSPSSL